MIRKKVKLINQLGLHARAAARLVQTASRYASDIQIVHRSTAVNGKSIMGIMLLAATRGTWLEIVVNGTDEEQALKALDALIVSRFDEDT